MATLHRMIQPSHRVVTIGPHAGLGDAWRLMRDQEVEHLVVVEGGAVLGVLSAKDLVQKGLAEPGQLPVDLEVLDIVDAAPVILTEKSDLSEAMALMRESGARAFPLVRHGAVVGLVTTEDLLEITAACLEDAAPSKRAEEETFSVLSSPLVANLMEMLDLAGI